jgi:energy-coupling factor transporter ATP-binding protein EcfA2
MATNEEKHVLDPRDRKELDKALLSVDRIVMKKYVADIDKSPIYQQAFNVKFDDRYQRHENGLSEITVGTNVMLLKLGRLVYDKEENILEKLTTVYNATALYENAALAMILRSDLKGITIYLCTVCKNNEDPFLPQKQIEALKDNFTANFPGSELELYNDDREKNRIVRSIFDHSVSIASVTGIAAFKDKESTDTDSYVQGMEKLIDVLRGKNCDVLILAEPVKANILNNIKSGYEELHTALTPFLKSEFTINSGNSKTVTDSVMNGITDTTSESLAKTKTHTITKGTNSAHTVGGSVGVNAGVNVGVFAGAFGVGASAGASLGVSTTADYHYMHGHHKDESDSTGETDTTGTSKAISTQNSIANALSENRGEGLQLTYENRTIKTIIERIDDQLERIQECEDFGMYDCGVYFMSEEYATCLAAATTYKSLMQGEKSSVESSHINIWDNEQSAYLIPYLSTFNHPIFDVSLHEKGEQSNGFEATPSMLVSGRELAIYMGLPKKSVTGLPVIKCTEFGRNILYSDGKKPTIEESVELGVIHHMHCDDENTKVLLNKKSLSSHVFITGSTGSGKSNTIYKLINEITKENKKSNEDKVSFMVIEPAKGEYKDVFGRNSSVTVYGTNPKKTHLLRINPFKFPEDIHVLEHIERLVEIFNVCWPMYAAMPAILKEAVERAYSSAGWNLQMSVNESSIGNYNIYPSFSDVLLQVNAIIEESRYSSDSKGDYIGALTMRLNSLTNGINGMLFTCNDIPEEKLFDENVIIDLSRIGSTETKSLIMGLLIIKLNEYRATTCKKKNSKLRHITILEEAHNILKRTSTEQRSESSNLMGKSVEMIANSIAEMRTYGEGFIIADQSPEMMDMSVIRNTNTKIILRLPDISDRELVGKAANLNDEQIEELARLQTGVAAVYQNNWVEPVLCKVDEWKYSEDEPYNNPEKVYTDQTLKAKIVEMLLKPACEKPVEQDLSENEIFQKILESSLTADTKIALLKYMKESDIDKIRSLRKKIIYKIFSPDQVLANSLTYRNDIQEWYQLMMDKLEPNITQYAETEVDKILAILTREKANMDTRREYAELYQNLITFLGKGRGMI